MDNKELLSDIDMLKVAVVEALEGFGSEDVEYFERKFDHIYDAVKGMNDAE